MNCSRRNKRCSNEREMGMDIMSNKSAISNLIIEITELLKRPNIDEQLGNILNKFLNNLNESERYLENGIFAINFAEASLLLEKCCVLYGKKMDILWNDVKENLQRLHSYSKSKSVSDEKELHEKINHVRGHKAVFQQEISKEDDFNHSILLQETENVPNLPQIVGSSCKSMENLWSKATRSTMKLKRLRTKVVPLLTTNIIKTAVHSKNSDKNLYNYQDLCLNLYRSGYMLHDDKLTQRYNLRHLIDDILQSYLALHEITYIKLAECNMWSNFKKYLQMNIAKRLRILLKNQRERMNGGWDRKRPLIAQKPIDVSMLHVFGEFQVSVDATEADEIIQVVEADSDSDVTMSPASPAKSYVSRRTSEMHSEADSAFHDGSFADDEERNVRSKQEYSYIQGSTTELRKNTISSDNTEYFEDSSKEKTLGDDTNFINRSDLMENGVSRRGWVNGNEEIEVIQEFGLYCYSEDKQENEQWSDGDHNFRDKYEHKQNEKDISSKIRVEKNSDEHEHFLQQKNARKRKRDNVEIDAVPKRREITRIGVTRQDSILTVPLITQENFFVRCYNREQNEGGFSTECEISDDKVCNVDASSSSSKRQEKLLKMVLIDHCYYKPKSSDELSTLIESPLSPTDDLCSINNAGENHCIYDVPQEASPNLLPLPERVQLQKQTKKTENEFHERIFKNSNDIEQLTRQKAALLDWKSFIQPKIDLASKNPDFDIHEYGTRIMDGIPLGESRNFNHVIKGKSASEVSRLFLATLQLANTNNVQLENVPKGQLANDAMSIKLLSRERYHEQLEGYIAPSEENCSDMFKKMCKLHSSTSTHSSRPNKKRN